MSLHNSLDNQIRLLAESRNFYKLYKPALATLREQEQHITCALEKLAFERQKLQNTQIDIQALSFFSITGTTQQIHEHKKKLYENECSSLLRVEKYKAAVTTLLSDRRYIQSKNTVENYQSQLKFYESQNLFR